MDKRIVITIAVILALCALCLWIGHRWGRNAVISTIVERHDTTVVYRTKFVEKPKYIASLPMGFITYTTADTLAVKGDSVVVSLPKEQRHYGDSTYDAWVSGYQPELDSLKMYVSDTIITNTIVRTEEYFRHNRVFLDAQMLYDVRPMAPITLNYGYAWKWGEVYGGAGYDPLTSSVVARAGVRLQISWK